MTAAPIIARLCNYCSRQLPQYRTHALTDAQTICDHCLEWHLHAIDVLAGKPPRGCQGCEATWETLKDREIGSEVRLYVVPKDGVYQLLCRLCANRYLPKREDLFRGTAFGSRKQLHV